MLSFPKKGGNKADAVVMPAWHPNFRNFQRLPDIKVVRTSFFVNGVAVIVTLALLIFVIYHQYELRALRDQTRQWQKEIEINKPGSTQSIVLYKKFQEEEKQIVAVQDFLSASKIVVSDFLLQLGETLPEGITLNTVDVRPANVVLRGLIAGTPDEASGLATVYVDALRKSAPFVSLFESITLTEITRDQVVGKLRFAITLKFKTPAKGAKK